MAPPDPPIGATPDGLSAPGAALFSALVTALAERYRLERELGVGGMATVYLAEDLKHRRRVAIKVLHPELSAILGPQRFLKEIETTANLQHPHILPLFDSGSANGLLYYVMPFIQGETLRTRLERERQLPVSDAVRIATETADALEYAHAHGVVHRDIKPENILLQNGHALVADFGIALAVEQAGGARMTQTGLSLGTPQYMSPEQAMGEQTVDARADLYALGAVTYEMLTGEPPHNGATAQAIVAKLLTEAVRPVTVLRPTVPAHVDAALQVALQQLPADRFPSAAAFAMALQGTAPTGGLTAPRPATAERRTRNHTLQLVPWLVAVIAAAAAIVLARRAPAAGQVIVASLLPPTGTRFELGGNFALSPDGTRLAFVAADAIWTRRLDSPAAVRLDGTTGARWPFWSPDGRQLGFFAGDELRIMPVAGGGAHALCPAPGGGGASWGTRGVIVFSAGNAPGIQRVAEDGGPCTVVTTPRPDDLTQLRPAFLPDGRHFLFHSYGNAGHVFLGDLDATGYRALPGKALNAMPGSGDWVLYSRDTTIYAQRLDVRAARFVGEPVTILESVTRIAGVMSYTVAPTGALVAHAVDLHRRLVWLDRHGAPGDSLVYASQSYVFDFSHDGSRVAFGGWGLYVHDLTRRVATRLTSAEGTDGPRRLTDGPVWSPGDSLIAYVARLPGPSELRLIHVGRGTSERLYSAGTRSFTTESWTSDGRFLTLTLRAGADARHAEVWIYSFADHTARPLLTSPSYDVANGRVSPDGRWIAYQSTETGRWEVYLQPFPQDGAAVRVSADGGEAPRWHPNSRELFYLSPNGAIMSVAVTPGAPPSLSTPQTVVARPPDDRDYRLSDYRIAPDGAHLVILQESAPATLLLVSDWRARAGAAR